MARILITGTSKGIGRGLVTELSSRGHDVVATARDPRSLSDLPAALALPLDVTDPASVTAAVEAAGPIDVVISNAGEIFLGSVEDSPLDEMQRLFEINTFGAVRVAQAVIPSMRQRGTGRLVFMSSVAGRVPLPLVGAYVASKWALEALGETLALELRRFGITVNLLEPGSVDSGALDAPRAHLGVGHYQELASQLGLSSSLITVDDVARATADVIETGDSRLRIPIGAPAEAILSAARGWPDERPFEPVPLRW